MQKRNSILYISFILVTLTMLTAFVVSELPRSEYDVFVGKVTRNLRKCMGAREAGRQEYFFLKEKTGLFPEYIRGSERTENVYIKIKKEDLKYPENTFEMMFEETIPLENTLLYSFDASENAWIFLELYEFRNEDDALMFHEYNNENEEEIYLQKRYLSRGGCQVMDMSGHYAGFKAGEKYIYNVYKVEDVADYVSEVYYCLHENIVVSVTYRGESKEALFSQYKEFLQQMQFEGVDDIVLEPVEIVD